MKNLLNIFSIDASIMKILKHQASDCGNCGCKQKFPFHIALFLFNFKRRINSPPSKNTLKQFLNPISPKNHPRNHKKAPCTIPGLRMKFIIFHFSVPLNANKSF